MWRILRAALYWKSFIHRNVLTGGNKGAGKRVSMHCASQRKRTARRAQQAKFMQLLHALSQSDSQNKRVLPLVAACCLASRPSNRWPRVQSSSVWAAICSNYTMSSLSGERTRWLTVQWRDSGWAQWTARAVSNHSFTNDASRPVATVSTVLHLTTIVTSWDHSITSSACVKVNIKIKHHPKLKLIHYSLTV